jgi:hypothetical protein
MKSAPFLALAVIASTASLTDAGAEVKGLTPPLDADSTAAAVSAILTVGGQTSRLPLQVEAAGGAPPAYDKQTSVASLSKSVKLFGGVTLKADAKRLVSTAVSAGKVGTTILSTATSTIASTGLVVTSPATGTLLTITSGEIKSHAAYHVLGKRSTVLGSSSIVSLVINAASLGVNNVTFSGTPTVNQILYQNSDQSLTVYLNAQMKTTLGDNATGLSVEAIDVHAVNLLVDGVPVSGDIAIGITSAKR